MYLSITIKLRRKIIQKIQKFLIKKSENQNQRNSYSYENNSKKIRYFEGKKSLIFLMIIILQTIILMNLTNDELVVKYLKEHGELPDYYITKIRSKIFKLGSGKGNLCEVAPGKSYWW